MDQSGWVGPEPRWRWTARVRAEHHKGAHGSEAVGRVLRRGRENLNRVFNVIGSGVQRKSMEKAGFVDIVERDFKVGETAPLHLWTGAEGRTNANYYRCRWEPSQRIRR